MTDRRWDRREFLAATLLASISVIIRPWPSPTLLHARARPYRWGGHPSPRPGITATRVSGPGDLRDYPDAIPAFDSVREIPQIVDGIRCQCGCADDPAVYSLLSCFEHPGMAKRCPVCQEQARVVATAFAQGKSLDEIRVLIDARFG